MYAGEVDLETRGQLASGLDEWTILSGADPAAAVAAYKLIKQWLDLRPDEADPPRVRVMFLGCDGRTARAAAAKIQRTVSQFLDMPLAIAGVQQQMQPVRRRQVDAFDLTEDRLARLLAGEGEGEEPSVSGAQPDAGDRLSEDELAALYMEDDEAPEAEEAPRPQPEVVIPPRHEAPARPASGLLCGHVPGLTAIAPRHPRHGAVELAVDGEGRLHLLAHDRGELENRALSALVEVQAWASEHAALLTLACPRITDAGSSCMHLFVADPRKYQGLMRTAGRGTPDLHLLLPVNVGSTTHWTHVPLTANGE